MGQVTKYPKKRNVDYWKWRGQLCFFFSPWIWSPAQSWLVSATNAKWKSHMAMLMLFGSWEDRIWIPHYNIWGVPEIGLPPQIINFHCIFHDINHPFMETPILQPSCRDISDNVQTHGVPWDADHCHRRGPTHFPRTWASSGASSKVIEFLLDYMVSIKLGYPKIDQSGWFFSCTILWKHAWFRGSPILGNPQYE